MTTPSRTLLRGPSKRLGVAAAFVDGRLIEGDASVRDGEIEAFGLTGHGEGVAVPGLLDTQVNGYAGVDVLDPDGDRLAEMGAALLRDGVTAYQPTLVTAPEQDMIAALRTIAELPDLSGQSAAVLGVHLEGPFLSPERAGAHPREHLRLPDVGLLERLLDAGPVRMVTLAPELPGALDLIAICVRRGIVVSLGHSQANAADVAAAFAAGATAVTHLFNAMAPLTAREPGVAGAALASPSCAIQLIADGVHVADESIRLAFAAAPGRCSLVSDAMAAATLSDGSYSLGPVAVEVTDGVARRSDGTIAGSVAPLSQGLVTLRRVGIDPGDAIAAVTERPAALLRELGHGRLSLGTRADVVVLDPAHRVQRVLVGGRELEPASH